MKRTVTSTFGTFSVFSSGWYFSALTAEAVLVTEYFCTAVLLLVLQHKVRVLLPAPPVTVSGVNAAQ